MATPPSELIPQWEKIYQVFDPEDPVHSAELRAVRDPRYDAIARMAQRLASPIGEGTRRYLVSGAVGSGKSTELWGAAQRLSNSRVVVMVDLWRHFQQSVGDPAALDHVQPWELLALFGLGILRAAHEAFSFDRWDGADERFQAAWQRMAKDTADSPEGAEVDVWKLAGQLAVATGGWASGGAAGSALALTLLETAAQSGTFAVKLGRRKPRPTDDQDPPVRALLEATNALIYALRRHVARPILLIADGLDRISSPTTLDALFVESRLLADLECEQVLCVPIRLFRMRSTSLRVYDPVEVTNLPVLDQADPTRDGAGVSFFRDLVARRLTGRIPVSFLPFSEAQIDRLARCSGGRARDFVKLVRLVVEFTAGALDRVSDEMIEAAIDERRRQLEIGINLGQLELLRSVMDDPDHRLPADEGTEILLDQSRLLAYPNQKTWYYPHPLLTLVQLPIRNRPHGSVGS